MRLPPEILAEIVSVCDDDSLPHLRLTCKSLCVVATHPFGETHLAERRFLITEPSLNGLVEMTAHPVFGRCVQKISFGTYRLEELLP